MNHTIKCTCKLATKMAEMLRSAIPIEGDDFKNLIMVDMKKGERIGRHTHLDYAALYYPADSEPITIEPKAGMIIYLPPGTPHAVPAVTRDRVSVAMLVEPKRDADEFDPIHFYSEKPIQGEL